jgi:hypothetical protein
MEAERAVQEFRPLLIPRRGELIAWASAVLTWLVWMALSRQGSSLSLIFLGLGILLLLSGLLISLGNWVDRKTVIRIDEHSIEFYNGLRSLRLNWDEITKISVNPGTWGRWVQVYSSHPHFSFRIVGEMRYKGEVRGRMGFEQGEEILRLLVQNSRLQAVDQRGEGVYYTR